MQTETIAPLLQLSALEKLREEELGEARAIQSLMQPEVMLRSGAACISHEFQPVATVGGDFLDYFELADDTVGLYLGDVSGKGLPAALYAALAVGTLRGVHKTGTSPGEVLATLNRRLTIRGLPRRHVAIQYAVFNPRNSQLQIASAGMSGPFHLTAAGCRMLELAGIPPGLFAGTDYETVTVKFNPGERMFFCTDGLTEAFDPDGDLFGIERMTDLCNAECLSPSPEILGHVFSAVKCFARGREPSDDMTAALFHCSGL